jgi:hypothetical protein
MSDSEAVPQDEVVVAPAGQAFKVVYLKLDEQGVPAFWGGRWTTLSTKIYDRKTALKFATHEAQRLPSNSVAEMLIALISPSGRCIAVLAGGTGKAVRPLVALRTKRALVTLMPDDVKVRRRTSRPATASRSIAQPGRKRRMTGRSR